MNAELLPESVLRALDGTSVPLKGVAIRGALRDLAADILVEQRYANETDSNLEAVYTFPLPVGAVLLSLDVEIGERHLSGQVVEKKVAETRYEEAVCGGDTAVMLELSGPGLYTMNVGNLMAGESAVIRYRYAFLLSWQGERVRLLLPTTIAPRYGDAEHAGLQPHQVPESSLRVDYPLDFALDIHGELADSTLSSPSHAVAMTRTDAGLRVTLERGATLDRDFILLLRGERASSATLLPHADAEGRQVALASLRIPPLDEPDKAPLALKIVIDCSGSMAGMSIAQARKAALEILDQLRPGDTFNVTLFGSEFRHFWPDMAPANARHIAHAWQRLEQLEADMGGTETHQALLGVYRLGEPEGRMQRLQKNLANKVRSSFTAARPQILLITDGEVWEHQPIIKEAVASQHRVFTVGVGMAVAEGLVSELARATGGACELVSPQEGMTEIILAQFHRMRQARIRQANIAFDVAPAWITPLPETLFAGDTVHVFAGFDQTTPQQVVLNAVDDSDTALKAEVRIDASEWTELPRMAAARRIAQSDDEAEQRRLALAYQLLTEHTNYLVVAGRADQAEDLPVLAKVPQMMAAGWGGSVDTLVACRTRLGICASVDDFFSPGPGVRDSAMGLMRSGTNFPAMMRRSTFDMPAFLRKSTDDAPLQTPARTPTNTNTLLSWLRGALSVTREPAVSGSPAEFIDQLQASLGAFLNSGALPDTIEELAGFGLPGDVQAALNGFIDAQDSERQVIGAFLMALLQTPALKQRFPRGLRRLIRAYWQRCGGQAELLAAMQSSLSGTTGSDWEPFVRDAAARELAA